MFRVRCGIHSKFRRREQRLNILRLGRIRHVADIQSTTLGDGLGSGAICVGAGGGGGRPRAAVLALHAPIGRVEGATVGADILEGRLRSF